MRSKFYPVLPISAASICFGLTFALLGLAAMASQPVLAATARPASLDTPEGTLWLFDSLLASPTPDAAQPLTVGPARRMFAMLKLSAEKITPFVDTAKSRDSVLSRWLEGGRATVKIRGTVHFKQSFMGMDSLTSVQAVQLARLNGRWRIATFQELPNAKTMAPLPTPADSVAWQAEQGQPESQPQSGGIFPVSKRMVPNRIKAQEVQRMTLKVSLRQRAAASANTSGPLAHLHLQEANGPQTLLQNLGDTAYTVAVIQPAWPPGERALSSDRKNPRPDNQSIHPDLQPYLISTAYVDLNDSALQKLSRELMQRLQRKPGASGHGAASHADKTRADYARVVYDHLVTHFDFQFGATLFGTSGESLRRMRGDCSEGAMLTCALLRAQGIPSRLALGFASAGGGAFIGHAWCEGYFGNLNSPAEGSWVGIDAALRELPAGAQRVRLAISDGQGDIRIMATNLVLGVLNNLDIEMLTAETRTGPITLVDAPMDSQRGRRLFEQILEGVGR